MSPEQEADIRALHIEYWASDDPDDMRCEDCEDPWPCDTAQVLAALDEARLAWDECREAWAEAEQLRRDALSYTYRAESERDAARADFDRLQDFVADADAAILDAFWFTEHNTPEAITARNAALAAHEAQREGA